MSKYREVMLWVGVMAFTRLLISYVGKQIVIGKFITSLKLYKLWKN